MKVRTVALLVAILAACLSPLGSRAQSAQGRISGQITDASGAAVAGASVTIENLNTHVARVLQTNSSGDYVAPDIDPGLYAVIVEAQGFNKVVREHVQIEVANDLRVNFQLKPGTLAETVQ